MKQIQIPNTDLTLSPMGMGCVNAGLKWDGKDADYLFDAFLDMGGNAYDTARVYSDWVPPKRGRSEQVLGDWLRRSKKRERVVLITKGGHPDMTLAVPDMHKSRMHYDDMRQDVELSLQALGTDYIDLYFYHRDDINIPVEQLIDTLQHLVEAGKIRYYACSNWSVERMKAADEYCRSQGYRGFAANQVLYNLGSDYMNPLQDDTLTYLDGQTKQYHMANNANLAMPYMGICNGFFHNFIEKGEQSVAQSPYYTEKNITMAKKIPRLMQKYGATITQIVLGFFTVQDFSCLPLYGPRNAENLKEALHTFEIPFTKQDFE